METIIFRTAAILGFRRLQSYMLPCLYALLLQLKHCLPGVTVQPATVSDLLLSCWLGKSVSVDHQRLSVLVWPRLTNHLNGQYSFIHSAGSYTLVYTITTNTSIVTAVSSNSRAVSYRNCLHVDTFSMLKYFRGQVDPRKYFNTKI